MFSVDIAWGQTKVINGRFDDWQAIDLRFEDLAGDGRSGSIDFRDLYMSDDDENIYLRIQLTREIEIQEFEDLNLYIDMDNNPNTGIYFLNFGVDFVYRFGQREGFVKVGDQFYDIFHNDFNLITLPTVSASEFEISFSKEVDIFQGTFSFSDQINFVLLDDQPGGDRLPDNGPLSYSMTNAIYTPSPYQINKSTADDTRLLSYNALQDGLFDTDRQPAFQRLITAIDPEIICFQEIYDQNAFEVAQVIESFLPSGPNEVWYHSSVSPDIHIISRYPITQTVASDGNGIFKLTTPDGPLIVINAHLPCCNRDEDRQGEVDRILNFIRNSKDGLTNMEIPENTPIIITGDMNFVGDRQQKISLLTGDIIAEQLYGSDFDPDWDGTAFEDAVPLVTNSNSAVTWFNPNGSFSSGRLDYFMYTGSVLELNNAYALNTTTLPSAQLTALNLERSDTYTASDHFPIVMDIDMSMNSDIRSSILIDERLEVFPNPSSGTFNVTVNAPYLSIESVEINAVSGKNVFSQHDVEMSADGLMLELNHLDAGIYFIKIEIDEIQVVKKIVIL